MTRPDLAGTDKPLTALHDVALLDLDGVVYVGTDPVPGAADAIERVRAAGMRVAFVTNNASRSPADVAALLHQVGVEATADDVVTSAQAGARVLAARIPAGSAVLVVGSDALAAEVSALGLRAVRSADGRPAGVIQGFDRAVGWSALAEATVAIRYGADWVATNADRTIPSPRGALPGNGALVEVVRLVSGAAPTVTGKPEPALHEESVRRTGAAHPLVVGDRLDTDIAGAVRAGCASLLVLTGVTTVPDLLAAGPDHRPTYLAGDLGGLLVAHPQPKRSGGAWSCRRFTARRSGDSLTLSGSDDPDGDPIDAVRALCAAAWADPPVRAPAVAGDGSAATQILRRFGLAG